MVAILILSLALFTGAASAFRLDNAATVSNERNGTNVTVLQQFPTIVQVEFLNQWGWWGWTQGCSASILNQRNVLTAASCFSGLFYPGPNYRRIRAGANIQQSGGVIVYVEREFNHFLFGSANGTALRNAHDISVVRLSSFLPFTTLIRQAPILAQGSVIPGNLWINQVGWGQRNVTGLALSSELIRTVVTSTNQTQSFNTTGSFINAIPTSNALINGDIGGPWIWANVTIGVIPADRLYLNSTLLATTISAYTNWILNTAR